MPRLLAANGLRRWSRALLAAAVSLIAVPAGSAPADDAPTASAASARVSAFRFATDDRVKHEIDLKRVMKGVLKADPRDGIPAIRSPVAVPAADIVGLRDDDDVVGMIRGVSVRAYPIRMLDHHEVVNDILSGEPVALTYCPLCDSAVGFSRRLPAAGGAEGRTLTFGVSGYLHESDVLLYDGETESFWQQFTARAVVGPLSGTSLPTIATERTTWKAWRALHPETTVLSWKTEYGWPPTAYDRPIYAEYRRSKKAMFPVSASSDRMPEKAPVYGLFVGGEPAAIPAGAIEGRADDPVDVRIGSLAIRLHAGGADGPVRAEVEEPAKDGKGPSRWEEAPLTKCYWFAWYVFHPKTVVVEVPSPAKAEANGR